MARGRVLPVSFFDRDVAVVARDLLGRVVESETHDGVVAVRLLETEAYAGEDDAASHAWRGRTPRTEVMFGPPGRVYVYFTYGMHWCANVVCGPDGRASAVLMRAGEVVSGLELARSRRRPGVPDRSLASGPANLASCLGLDGTWTGQRVTSARGPLRLRAGEPVDDAEVATGPRIGITRAAEVPWRWWVGGNPHVSGPRRAGG
ncbi:MAG: DNA-3-methyladenine glycosylase [Candidatus Nanopelagicales bacterium]